MAEEILRCATLLVADIDAAVAWYREWLDYRMIDDGTVDADQAKAWASPVSEARRWAFCAPSSGANIFVRFVGSNAVPDYRPIYSFGWGRPNCA